jgi:hypothetical protein
MNHKGNKTGTSLGTVHLERDDLKRRVKEARDGRKSRRGGVSAEITPQSGD